MSTNFSEFNTNFYLFYKIVQNGKNAFLKHAELPSFCVSGASLSAPVSAPGEPEPKEVSLLTSGRKTENWRQQISLYNNSNSSLLAVHVWKPPREKRLVWRSWSSSPRRLSGGSVAQTVGVITMASRTRTSQKQIGCFVGNSLIQNYVFYFLKLIWGFNSSNDRNNTFPLSIPSLNPLPSALSVEGVCCSRGSLADSLLYFLVWKLKYYWIIFVLIVCVEMFSK